MLCDLQSVSGELQGRLLRTSLNEAHHPPKSTTQPNYATKQPLEPKGYKEVAERH
jgi:hypothetical protein